MSASHYNSMAGKLQLFLKAGTVLAAAAILVAQHSVAQSFSTVLSSNLFQPTALAVSPENSYVITDSSNHRIVEFNADTKVFRVMAGGEQGAADGQGNDARMRNPQGIVPVADGYVFADTGNHLIRHLSHAGVVTTLAGNTAAAHAADELAFPPSNFGSADGTGPQASFDSPASVAWDGNDTIYVADTLNGSIRAVRISSGETSTLVSGLSMPTGVEVGAGGVIYISETATHSILAYKDGALQVLAGRRSAFESGLRDSTTASQGLLRAPRGLYYRGAKDELIVVDSGNKVLRRIYGLSGSPGIDTFANSGTAGFNNPVNVARDNVGMFLVVDKEGNQIQGITTDLRPRVPDPRIGRIIYVLDATTGLEQAVFEPVTDETFETPQEIVISGDGEANHFFNFGAGSPVAGGGDNVPTPDNHSDNVALNFVGPSSRLVVEEKKLNIDPLPVLVIKTISYDRDEPERVPSRVVTATFRFQVAAPAINTTAVPGAVAFSSITPGVTIWYTLNGEDPVNDPTNPAMHVLEDLANSTIPLPIGRTLKVRGYKKGFAPSAIVTKKDFTPIYISLGYPYGEASSDFIGAAGQRFYAPVTLTAPQNVTAYGLQFSLSVQGVDGVAPLDGTSLSFDSMLYERLPGDIYVKIPPAAVVALETNIIYFDQISTNTDTVPPALVTNLIPVSTNWTPVITNLLSTNSVENILMVGWSQRILVDELYSLYNTRRQDLISFSIPRDRIYEGKDGKIIPGAFSFVVPVEAPAGAEYEVRVDRSSATADGVSRDIFIKPVDPADILNPDNPAFGFIPSVRKMVVGSRVYRVGDVAPFGWYNAGEFGDTNILNNDITQMHQSIAYGINMPPPGSDFEDAMDTCCVTTNGMDIAASFDARNGVDFQINEIGFGDGKLDVADLFVAFRRALDHTLVWYGRYWSNGVRHAVIVPNMYRGVTGFSVPTPASSGLSAAAVSPSAGLSSKATLKIGSAAALPGDQVSLPIVLKVDGTHPARALMFAVKVESVEGGLEYAENITFSSTGVFGAPTAQDNSVAGRYSAAWLDTSIAGLVGEQVIGYLQVRVPENASANSLLRVQVENVSSSPNGFAVLPSETVNGSIIMANRPPSAWQDGISDQWRVQHFGQVYSPESHPDFDPDGDGVPNKVEFVSGTNPRDPSDRLKLELRPGVAKALQLRWRTVSGKRYILESSPALLGGTWTPVTGTVEGTGSEISVDEGGTARQLYYRIRLAE